MKPGDLIKIKDFNKMKIPGALTAINYYKRMDKKFKGKVGIMLKDNEATILVLFENQKHVIHKDMVEVVDG